jgi:heterodisulfide reductase subunit A
MKRQNIVVIGAGIAGMKAAVSLAKIGYSVDLIEKNAKTGGHVDEWKKTFPYLNDAKELTDALQKELHSEYIHIHTDSEIAYVSKNNSLFELTTTKNKHLHADAVLLTTGFDNFNAWKKEEYGYGIYKNVITNVDLEQLFHTKWTQTSSAPNVFGFMHCVGSRDAKSGNIYCSRVCCATAVKQAIEVKTLFPKSEVYCFYMDLRMYGNHFEELYKEAQEKYGIHFIRARLSEVSQTIDEKLTIRVEDTLTSKPLKMTLDYIVLMTGMTLPTDTAKLIHFFQLSKDENGFVSPKTPITEENLTETNGVFIAGTISGPKTILDTLNDATSAAMSIHLYLLEKTNHLQD